jgi:sec-independent protein translocase protein TatA
MARSIGQSARVFKGEMKGMKNDGAATDAAPAPADPPAATPAPAPLPPATASAPPATPPVQQQQPTPATGQGHSTPPQ